MHGSHIAFLTTPQSCTYIGGYAGRYLDDGTLNTAVGHGAMEGTTGGSSCQENVAVGHHTLTAITTGDYNVAVGAESLKAITTESNNTAVGYKAAEDMTGELNAAVGTEALKVCSGNANTAIGYKAGASVTGATNTIIGHQAGFDTVALTSGTNNVIIGDNARTSAADSTNQVVIGRDTQGVGDNSVTLGNASILNVYAGSDGGAHVHCSGVSFPATQDASGGANVLDDYEEGNWTPVLADVSGNTATMDANTAGAYVKIGRQVTLTARLTCSSLGSCSGNMKITGLPFTVGNHNKFYNSVSIGYGESLAIPDDTSISGYGGQNTTTIVLWNWDDAAGGTALQHSEITADGTFFITTTYFIG